MDENNVSFKQPDKLTGSGSMHLVLPGTCCELSPSSLQYVSFLVPQQKNGHVSRHKPHKRDSDFQR